MTFDLPRIDDVVAAALAEDLGVGAEGILGGSAGAELLNRDVTSSAVLAKGASFKGIIVARAPGVICGLPVTQRVWEMLAHASASADIAAPSVEVFPLVAEGTSVDPGTAVAEIEGPAAVVLAGERTALNMLMLLSGIATQARRWQLEAGDSLTVLDTRKTVPGMRALSKYAVRVGGAGNHRAGLHDMVLIKDNHIRHCGGITTAVTAARQAHPGLLIEVEADTIPQAQEAASAGADIVLLDNMDDSMLASAVAAVRQVAQASRRQILTEASGGITFERLAGLGKTGVDRVSTSVLTLAPPLDFGLDEL